jgi:hypothetical protein
VLAGFNVNVVVVVVIVGGYLGTLSQFPLVTSRSTLFIRKHTMACLETKTGSGYAVFDMFVLQYIATSVLRFLPWVASFVVPQLIMYYLLLFYLSRCSALAETENHHYCQSTNSVATDTRLGYPLFYFKDSGLRSDGIPQASTVECDIVGCDNHSGDNDPAYNVCPIRSVISDDYCPITQTLVDGALNVMQWPHLSKGLCGLQKLSKEASETSVVKVLYFGGSMTSGECTAQHCCCTNKVGCNSGEGQACGIAHLYEGGDYCKWSLHFSSAMLSLFPGIKFVFRQLSGSGWNSAHVAEEIFTLLHQFNIGSLTSNDVIMLDFSTNDGSGTCMGAHPELMHCRLGLETLIRRLYFYANTSLPSIVLIEQFPDLDCWRNRYNYSSVYRSTAQHYRLPLLSYPAALFAAQDKQPYLVDRLRAFGQELHPPWYVHI